MPTVSATNATMVSVVNARAPGDIVELAAGVYTAKSFSGLAFNASGVFATQMATAQAGAISGSFAGDLATAFANNVTIRPADRNDPPVWNVGGLTFNNCTGITLDGLEFRGTVNESVTGGVAYPAQDRVLEINNFRNFWIKNCTMDFHRRQVYLGTPGENLVIERCEFSREGVDVIQWECIVTNALIRRNVFGAGRINQAAMSASRHPDKIQRDRRSNSVIEEYNHYTGDTINGKPIFNNHQQFVREPGTITFADAHYRGLIQRHNFSNTGHYHGIFNAVTDGTRIYGNTLRRFPGASSNPGIRSYTRNDAMIIQNNVTAGGVTFSEGDTSSGDTLSGNVTSATAFPTGWVDLVPGTNCGPYTGESGPTAPAALTILQWTIPGAVPALPLHPARFTGVISIPTTSPAYAAGFNPTEFEWIRPTVATPKPFALNNPPTTATDPIRLLMLSGPGGDQDVYSVAPSGTMTGITIRYRLNGVWSAMSDAKAFTAPASQGTDTLDALEAAGWSVDSVVKVRAGFYTGIFEVTGETIFGLEWSDNGTTWRPTIGLGSNQWQMLPAVEGGEDHLVSYLEVLTVRVRWFADVDPSPQSVDQKTVTGPAAPVQTLTPGDRLAFDGNLGLVDGRPMIAAAAVRPGEVVARRGSEFSASLVGANIEVVCVSAIPTGAIGIRCAYEGNFFDFVDGIATMPAGVATRGVVFGYDANNVRGIGRTWRLA